MTLDSLQIVQQYTDELEQRDRGDRPKPREYRKHRPSIRRKATAGLGIKGRNRSRSATVTMG